MKNECKKCGQCCYMRIGVNGMIIETNTKCEHLTSENLCDIYEDRPSWCLSAKDMKNMGVLPKNCGYVIGGV